MKDGEGGMRMQVGVMLLEKGEESKSSRCDKEQRTTNRAHME